VTIIIYFSTLSPVLLTVRYLYAFVLSQPIHTFLCTWCKDYQSSTYRHPFFHNHHTSRHTIRLTRYPSLHPSKLLPFLATSISLPSFLATFIVRLPPYLAATFRYRLHLIARPCHVWTTLTISRSISSPCTVLMTASEKARIIIIRAPFTFSL
jgi:hypothetical protein